MKYVLIAAGVILVVFLAVLSQIPIGIEPLTELYFENHTELPKTLKIGEECRFAFTIHNLEYIDMNYTYEITAEYRNEKRVINTDNVFLADNESKMINEKFKLNEHFERAKINVKLIKLTENPMQKDPNLKNITINIHFWVDEA